MGDVRLFMKWLIVFALIAVVGVLLYKGRKAYLFSTQMYDWGINRKLEQDYEMMYKNGDYAELVAVLDQRSQELENWVEKYGGWESLLSKEDFHKWKASAYGCAAVYVHFYPYMDYNAQFLPRDVELFLTVAAYDSWYYRKPRGLPAEWLMFANVLEGANHPILKAYGLWFQNKHEEYRDFVYGYANRGDVRFYGFAAHATRYDIHERAFEHLARYHQGQKSLENGVERDAYIRAVRRAKYYSEENISISDPQWLFVRQAIESLQTNGDDAEKRDVCSFHQRFMKSSFDKLKAGETLTDSSRSYLKDLVKDMPPKRHLWGNDDIGDLQVLLE